MIEEDDEPPSSRWLGVSFRVFSLDKRFCECLDEIMGLSTPSAKVRSNWLEVVVSSSCLELELMLMRRLS